MAKQEQNLIKLDEFNIQQLPELQNKKQEVSAKLEQFKYVEIKDNTTYEEAKKSRTGARTLRTDLQKEQKAVEKKIKDHVLVPVKNAYDELIDSVLPIENKQQDEVSRWEEIKEKERQEKLLLEQQRVDGIKKCISEFKSAWLETVDRLLYPGIDSFLPMLEDIVSKMDRTKFEEFEILFDDAISEIKLRFNAKRDLLISNEELRLERERLAQIQAEQNRVNVIKTKIDSWEKNWLYVINNLEFRNISVTQNEFETQTALDCQELQSEYAEKRNQIQELLSVKVSQLKEAEEQRIEREIFLKEKAEFEAKQIKLRTESRIKQLTDLGIEEDVIFDELGNRQWANNKNLAETSSDEIWSKHLEWVKTQIKLRDKKEEPIKSDGYYTSEENYVEQGRLIEDGNGGLIDTTTGLPYKEGEVRIFNSSTVETITGKLVTIRIAEIKDDCFVLEETWADILQEYYSQSSDTSFNETEQFVDWLEDNYNVPTKK